MASVITVRVPEELKDDLKKYGVEAAEVARRAWEEEVRKRKIEEASLAAQELGEFFSKIGIDEVVKMIREDRDSR